jgi:capsular exopolysaccharide synthesis family protein
MSESIHDFSLTQQFKLIFKNWYWFILSFLIFMLAGYAIYRYSTTVYQATGSVLIKDTKRGGLSEMGALGDLNILGNTYNTVENEIEVFQSRRLLTEVVKELDLYINYLIQGNIKESSVYKTAAVSIKVLNEERLRENFEPVNFTILPHSSLEFKLKDVAESEKTVEYGEVFIYNGLELIVIYDDSQSNNIISFPDTKIVITSIQTAVLSYYDRLLVEKVDKRSSVLDLTVSDTSPLRAEEVVNTLIDKYNEDAIKDKNAVARKTAEFIQERMSEVKKDLDSLERSLQTFKDDRSLTDIAVESVLNLEKSTGYTNQVLDVQTKINIVEGIQRDLNSSDFEILPEALGVDDGNLQDLAVQYNKLLLNYRSLLKSASDINPSVIRLKEQLEELRISLKLSVDQVLSSLRAQSKGLRRELNRTVEEVRRVPENERLQRVILRNREVIESIYLLLSEKRETTAISLVVTTPKAKIVDYALANPVPISPKPIIILLSCLILSFILPYSVIYLRELLYNKIESRHDIEHLHQDITVLGELPKFESSSKESIEPNDRSILAESFRILRTNLQFKLSALTSTRRDIPTILVTSTVKGEGKTFVSYNLSLTLALTNKRVLLIGGDIRNPQIHRYLPNATKDQKGLTELLTNDDIRLDDIKVTHEKVSNLDIILSGAIPPNPAELLMSERMESVLDKASSVYDYIILDSAPTILVTDTLLISKYSDVTVYVTRANYTDKPLLSFIKENVERKKLNNVSLVLNDVKQSNFGYGSKYSYHYSSKPQGILAKIRRLFSSH